MNQLAIAVTLLAAAAGCSKKSDDKAATPAAAKTASAAAPTPTGAAAAATPTLSSNVKLAIDPEAVFADKQSSLDFSGPALVFANKQPSGEWSYDVVFYPPGVTATCDTSLDLDKPLENGRALEIWFEGFTTEPKAGLVLTGKFNPHFTNDKGHTTGGLHDGAKVTLTKIEGATVMGELTSETDDGSNIKSASGTFTGLLCTWGDDEPAEEDTADEGRE